MLILFFGFMTLSIILMILNSSLGTKSMVEREKLSAFECGFDAKSMSRLPFSLHFFLIALIFLIFDVEITLILPLPMVMESSSISSMSLLFTFFMGILILGVAIEWKNGALDWTK